MPRACTKSREEIASDLNSVTAKVREICEITGIVGLSAAVIHHGEEIWKENIGYRDLKNKLKVTSDTIFPIGALGEGFTAACLAKEGWFFRGWFDTHISDYLRAKHPDSDDLTIGHLLRHRTGLQAAASSLLMHGGRRVLDRKKASSAFNRLKRQAIPGSQFIHGAINYAILEDIASCGTREGYERHLEANVLQPLGMSRTFDAFCKKIDNQSLLYSVMRDGQPHEPDFRFDVKSRLHILTGGMASTVNDLIRYYKSVNRADLDPDGTVDDDRFHGTFHNVNALLEKTSDGKVGRGYAAGWAACTLPATLGDLGINSKLGVEMPRVAPGCDEVTVYWNQGMYYGANSFVAVVPKYKAAVIVLTNTTTANDAADWIGQLLLETLLDSPHHNDYPFLASITVYNAYKMHEEMVAKIEKGRETGGSNRSLRCYRGSYAAERYIVDIELSGFMRNTLTVVFDNGTEKGLTLKHHHGDSFTWSSDWDDMVRGGMPIGYHPEHHFFHFHPSKDGKKIVSLTWVNDPGVPDGKVFVKK